MPAGARMRTGYGPVAAAARGWARRRRSPRLTILGYHDVLPVPTAPHHIAVAAFEAQMELLAERAGVSALEDPSGARSPSAAGVAITFDDARDNFLEFALPTLERLRLPATLFAPSRLLGRPGHLRSEELREVADRGVAVGSHARSHCSLRDLPAGLLADEIAGSRRELEELLERPVTTFSYPYGHWDGAARAEVADAGYRLAVTTRPGRNTPATDPLLLHRSWPESTMTMAWFEVMVLGGDDLFNHPRLRALMRLRNNDEP